MTAQALFMGMFGNSVVHGKSHQIVALHTADRSRDILSKNTNLCPRLNQLKKEGVAAPDFQAFNVSSEAQLMRKLMGEKLGRVMSNPSDCLMTTICNDRTLPKIVNDYHGESRSNDMNLTSDYEREFGKDRFRRLVDFVSHTTRLHVPMLELR
jgi:hypothetical protein